MHKLKKLLIILISAIAIIMVVVVIFISTITKYLVERYDEKYTGRQVEMKRAFVNPFTGYIHFAGLKIHEQKSQSPGEAGDSIFFSAKGLSINIAMLKLLSKTYEISKLTLNHPSGIIIQNKKDFNFNDLVDKFSSEANSDSTRPPVHFNILNVKIIEGVFSYREELIPINYSIKKVNIESTGKKWDADTVNIRFSLSSGVGSGEMNGNFTFDLKNKDYRLVMAIDRFDLNIIGQYLKDLANYGSFSASLDADIKSRGNFGDIKDGTTSGKIAISDFHFGKNPFNDYASFDKLVMGIKEMSPKKQIFYYDSVYLSHPCLKYERYDSLDNLQTMFGKNGGNIKSNKADPTKFNLVIEIANYIKLLSEDFFQSHYSINHLSVENGEFKFNDFSLSERFSMELDPLNVTADSIDKDRNCINISLKSGIKPYGYVSAGLSVNPKYSGEFDLEYHLQKLAASMFNPYTISYTSFPLDRGTMEINGTWNVRDGIIKSNNHLVIIDPRVTRRLRNKDLDWIPMPLILFFIRERGNVIDYEIPITGNLKDPKFHFKDVIFDLLGNIFIKPATIPYRLLVKNTENEIEKSLSLKWKMRQNSLRPEQEEFIVKMADFLVENPEASIAVHPQQYETKEKEYILFFEAKKRYFMLTNNRSAQSFREEDSVAVDKMSVKDSMFVHFINKQIDDSLIFTIQEKCAYIIDSALVNDRFEELNKIRENVLISYFKKKEVDKRITFSAAENVIPYNGFSFYRIEYKGEFPESIIQAYRQMNELNDEAPRKKFQKERMYNRAAL